MKSKPDSKPDANPLLDMLFNRDDSIPYDTEDARIDRQARGLFRVEAMKGIQDVLNQLGVIQRALAAIRKEQREHLSTSLKYQELEALADAKREEMDVLHGQAQGFTDALQRIGGGF